MATTYTDRAGLAKPARSDRDWDVALNANADLLEGTAAIGSLAVARNLSGPLLVKVAAGSYVKADGTVGTYAGAASIAIAASTTRCLWLTDAGVLTQGIAFPTTAHLRLAVVSAGPTTITAIVDARVNCEVTGTGLGFVPTSGGTIVGSLTVATPGTGTPLLNLDATARTVGFFGSTPAGQANALPALTSTSGVASDSIADAGGSYSQATLNNNFASLAAKVNALTLALKRHGLMGS